MNVAQVRVAHHKGLAAFQLRRRDRLTPQAPGGGFLELFTADLNDIRTMHALVGLVCSQNFSTNSTGPSELGGHGQSRSCKKISCAAATDDALFPEPSRGAKE